MKCTILVAVLGCAAAQKPGEEPFELSGAYSGDFSMGAGSVEYNFPLTRSCTSSKEDCGFVAYPHLSTASEILMFNNAKCVDRWWTGPDADDVCTYFVEEFSFTQVSTVPDGSYGPVGMAPQRDGSILWNYFNGMVRLDAAYLYPSGMPKNEAKEEALRAELALEQAQQQTLPAWNPALNGIYEGMASNPVNPSPYPVFLELNVTDTCFKNCGSVTYPSQGLNAPMSNLIPVDPARLPELKGPNGTGRCWQLNEDYTQECYGTDPGWATSPVVLCEQTDDTLQWSMLWRKPEIAIVSRLSKTNAPVPAACPGGSASKCRFTGCSAEVCNERC